MKKPLLALIALTVVAGCGAPVTAPKATKAEPFTAQARTAELKRSVKRMFELSASFADKDGDKRISFEEAQVWGMTQEAFTRHDTNGDGFLVVAEMATESIVNRYVKHLNDVAAGAVLALDRDGDRKLTAEELTGPALTITPAPWQVSPNANILPEAFAAADRNADGKLTAAETESFFGHLIANGYGYSLTHSDPLTQPGHR